MRRFLMARPSRAQRTGAATGAATGASAVGFDMSSSKIAMPTCEAGSTGWDWVFKC